MGVRLRLRMKLADGNIIHRVNECRAATRRCGSQSGRWESDWQLRRHPPPGSLLLHSPTPLSPLPGSPFPFPASLPLASPNCGECEVIGARFLSHQPLDEPRNAPLVPKRKESGRGATEERTSEKSLTRGVVTRPDSSSSSPKIQSFRTITWMPLLVELPAAHIYLKRYVRVCWVPSW